jgi:transcriptional regulator with XRE-family HTH domain
MAGHPQGPPTGRARRGSGHANPSTELGGEGILNAGTTFGTKLRELRHSRGISLAQLSLLIHFNKGYLSKIENGLRHPSRNLAQRCDEVLGTAGRLAELVPHQPAATRQHVPPAQLPADRATFVGRRGPLAQLNALLRKRSTAVGTAVVTGDRGTGKSSLAVHWAHRVADRFPDGQLYVDLRGTGAGCADPADVLAQFVSAFDRPAAAMPASLDARAALYRSLVAGRRILVVLDNARDADQIRMLLPGSASCSVVITSRDPLTGLVADTGARPLVLDRFTEAESRELLARHLTVSRTTAEPQAVRELIDLCDHLPASLALVAASAASNPDRPLAEYVRAVRHARTGDHAAHGTIGRHAVGRADTAELPCGAGRFSPLLSEA